MQTRIDRIAEILLTALERDDVAAPASLRCGKRPGRLKRSSTCRLPPREPPLFYSAEDVRQQGFRRCAYAFADDGCIHWCAQLAYQWHLDRITGERKKQELDARRADSKERAKWRRVGNRLPRSWRVVWV